MMATRTWKWNWIGEQKHSEKAGSILLHAVASLLVTALGLLLPADVLACKLVAAWHCL